MAHPVLLCSWQPGFCSADHWQIVLKGTRDTRLHTSVPLPCTAGYGNTFPNECWSVSWLMQVQSIFGMLLDAITIGIVFARISLPKQRGRTIAISDKATIARRDGILKFMFRVADIRRTQVGRAGRRISKAGLGCQLLRGRHCPSISCSVSQWLIDHTARWGHTP